MSEMKAVIDDHKYQVKLRKTKFLVTPIANIGLQPGEQKTNCACQTT